MRIKWEFLFLKTGLNFSGGRITGRIGRIEI